MIIQSKKVWFADQFVEAQIEVKDGKIVDIYEYGTHPVDCDYGDNRILPGFIDVHCHELTALIRMMRKKTDFVTGCAIL